MKNLWKNHKLAIIYLTALFAFTVFVGLEVFVIPHKLQAVAVSDLGEDAGENTGEAIGEAEESTAVGAGETAEEDAVQAEDEAGKDTDADDNSDRPKKPGNIGNGGRGPGKDHKPEKSGDSEDTNSTDSTENTENSTASGTALNNFEDYSDENITIKISETLYENTHVYAADVTISSPQYLKTAFAEDTCGLNIKAYTSEIAADNDAILAVNGDFYGARETGYVIRNGTLYRNTGESGREDLVIDKDGSFSIISEDEVSAEELLADGAYQVLSFGPGLIEDGELIVSEDDEVDQALKDNPRTAIGEIDSLHYVFVVSDGRTDESAGLSLLELAEYMKSLNVRTAYNLDGGGSSTMYYRGEVINNPTTGGNSIKERSVSDIVFIGY